MKHLAEKDEFCIWHAGCSSGLEVYSMIILLSEMGMLSKARIYATDLSTDILAKARKGSYRLRFNMHYLENYKQVLRALPNNLGISDNELFQRYLILDKTTDQICIKPEVMAVPIFERHDLVGGAVPQPFGRPFDLVVCRNVIIYCNYILQDRIFETFYQALTPDGMMWMGVHESIHGSYLSKFEKKGFYYVKDKQNNGLSIPSVWGFAG
jgi:chemotaxis protein methyltransferase CheR